MATRRLPLHARVLLVQLAIVLVVAVVACAALLPMIAELNERQYTERALGVAQAVARIPEVRRAFASPDPAATIQPLAEDIRRSADVAFVVVANRELVRYSHPNPVLIGRPLTEGVDGRSATDDSSLGLDGQPHIVRESGSLGPSIRAKVPIFAEDGQTVLGVVSVGILTDTVEGVLLARWPWIALAVVVSLLLGASASYLLAGRVKRDLFGLEPLEIAALVEQREAMLHGIREGVLAIDRRGVITIANDEARRLLDLPEDAVGWPVADLLPESTLPRVLQTGQGQEDQLTLAHNGRAIVVNRMPVLLRGQLVGAISTFRDQTEVQRLAEELNGTRSHLDALRAQAHEFANKLHTIAGLLELGWYEHAIDMIDEETQGQQALIDDLPRRIGDPALAALLVGKASVAAERGVVLEVTRHSRLEPRAGAGDELITIVGNLVDNALDATAGRAEGRVRVTVSDRDGGLRIVVEDTGPGVADAIRGRIFDEGFSTKAAKEGFGQRGIGLALVRHAVRRLGGELTVRSADDPAGGAVFTVYIPAWSSAPTRKEPGGARAGREATTRAAP